jgi:outer membrane protein
MKHLKTLILTATLLGLLGLPVFAQTKIATVDMQKIFSAYYKTKLADAQLQKRQSDLRKDLKDMSDGIDKAEADYKQALEQSDDLAISTEERDKRKQAAADLLKDLDDRKVAAEQYQRQAQSTFQDMNLRMRNGLIADIQKAVADKAKAGGYTMVLNSAANEVVVYSAGGDTDLTADTIKELNEAAPIDVATPATTNTSMP